VIQAEAQMQAKEEEDNYLLIKARADLKLAELEVRKNPLVSVIAAKQAIWHRRPRAKRWRSSSAIWRIARRHRRQACKFRKQDASRPRSRPKPRARISNDDSARAQRRYANVQNNMNTNMFFPGCTCRCCN